MVQDNISYRLDRLNDMAEYNLKSVKEIGINSLEAIIIRNELILVLWNKYKNTLSNNEKTDMINNIGFDIEKIEQENLYFREKINKLKGISS